MCYIDVDHSQGDGVIISLSEQWNYCNPCPRLPSFLQTNIKHISSKMKSIVRIIKSNYINLSTSSSIPLHKVSGNDIVYYNNMFDIFHLLCSEM